MLDCVIETSRGLAALWVFLFHMHPSADYPFLAALGDLGHLGVPMFFVISGYCIGASAWTSALRGDRPRNFLKRRLRRIYPPFWASMLVVIAVPYAAAAISSLKSGQFALPQPSWATYSTIDWAELATLGRVFFSHGETLDIAFSAFNTPYWTLGIEVQFYLVVYAAMHFGRRAELTLVAVTVAGAVAAMIPAAYLTGLFLPYWPWFAIGLGLHRLVLARATPIAVLGRHHQMISLVSAAALVLAFVILLGTGSLGNFSHQFHYLCWFLFAGAFAVLLWLAIDFEATIAGIAANGALVPRGVARLALAIGAASYSLYLLHPKLAYLSGLFVRQVVPAAGLAGIFATMALTVALAYVFYLYVERRFMSQRRKDVGAPAVSTEIPGRQISLPRR